VEGEALAVAAVSPVAVLVAEGVERSRGSALLLLPVLHTKSRG